MDPYFGVTCPYIKVKGKKGKAIPITGREGP
jgi:hypothetical protein